MLRKKDTDRIVSLLDNTPLRGYLRKNVDLEYLASPESKLPAELLIGTTNINTGKQGIFASPKLYEGMKDFYNKQLQEYGIIPKSDLFMLDKDNIDDAVVASTSIPMAFPPVTIGNNVYIDGTGNCCPAKNGIEALYALDHNLKEGLLFVVLLDNPDNRPPVKNTEDQPDIFNAIGKTLGIGLEKISNMDVERAQVFTNELERWSNISKHVQSKLKILEKSNKRIQEGIDKVKERLNLISDSVDKKEMQEIFRVLSKLNHLNIRDIDYVTEALAKYKPFKEKNTFKVVIIRPEKPINIDRLDFDSVRPKSDEVIRQGYETTLNTLMQQNLIDRCKYNTLMQQQPYPIGKLFFR